MIRITSSNLPDHDIFATHTASSGTTNLGITLGGSLPAQLQAGVGNLNGSSLFPTRSSRSAAAAATANAYLQYYPPVALEREQHQQEAASYQMQICLGHLGECDEVEVCRASPA